MVTMENVAAAFLGSRDFRDDFLLYLPDRALRQNIHINVAEQCYIFPIFLFEYSNIVPRSRLERPDAINTRSYQQRNKLRDISIAMIDKRQVMR